MFRVILGITLFGCITSYASAASCTKPEAPLIPDPNIAVTAQMVKAQKEVKAYVAKAEKYLSCVRRDSLHDAMVDEMKTVADSFNQSVRLYKERMANA